MEFTLGMAALLGGSLINLAFPEIARRVLDPTFFPLVLKNLHFLTAGLGTLFIVQGIVFFFRSLLLGRVGYRVATELRERLFGAILARDVAFFDTYSSGDLVSRVNADASLVQDAVSTKLSILLRYGVQVVLGVLLMAWMSWHLTAAIVASVVTVVTSSGAFARNLRAASRRFQGAIANLTAFAAECFKGIRTVRALGAEQQLLTKFGIVAQESLQAGINRTQISAAFSSGASLLLNLLLLLIQWYGIHLVITGQLALNDLAAFVLYGAIVAVSFTFLVTAYTELLQSLGGLERVLDLIEGVQSGLFDAATNGTGGAASSRANAEGASLVFDKVSFSYPGDRSTKVLDSVSLQFTAGEVTAVVGPSGAGKSSLVLICLGFYVPEQGRVLLNGQSLESVPRPLLRQTVSWAPQEPQLFGFSVADNLLLGNTLVGREELSQITQSWRFLDFINQLPQGLETVLGEGGTQLSGGQRQRLAIARSLLRKPSVLILDEATSGLDSTTEEQVFDTIKAVIPRATVIIISHRLATVRGADKVYVLEEGQVTQEGTHDSLREKDGLYQRFVARQALA